MRVLVIGSGGREHALARALARDGDVTGLHVAPGNPGIAAIASCVAFPSGPSSAKPPGNGRSGMRSCN